MSSAAHKRAAAQFTVRDLNSLGRDVPGHWIRAGDHDGLAMEGRFQLRDAPTGISVHATDLRELDDFEVTFDVPAGVKLLIQLDGETRCRFGPRDVLVSAANGPVAELFVLPKPTTVLRSARAGGRVRKVLLTIPAAWFDRLSDRLDFAQLVAMAEQAGQCRWSPSPALREEAARLVALQQGNGLASALEQDRIALTLIQDGIAMLESLCAGLPQRSCDADRLDKAQNYIETHLHPELSTAEIAQAVGASPRVLERLFRRLTGQTIGQYRRNLGLARAQIALARDHVSVAEAARIAGYGNPSSFSAAFHRAYQKTPSDMRSAGVCAAHTGDLP
ncbi:MAG: AraC family transcriptional regulator [Mangrovicoccus sp.]|nr:AraC family transcriptional regulator [Mangrovicoccus sp.]